MKKVLSLFLSVIMLFSITAGTDFSSFADDNGTIIPGDHVHHYNAFVTEPATCTTDGIMLYWCFECDRQYTETIPKLPHTEVIDEAVPATCKSTGLTQGSHCSVCNEIITPQQVVAKTAHQYDNGKITKKATCTANGIKTYTCKICKATKTQTIKATGHKAVKDKAVKPTYVKAGKTEGSHCSVCKRVIKAQKTVAKLKLAKPSSVKLSAVSKGFKLSWKKAKDASGYQIQYSTSSKFKSTKTVTVNSKTTSKTIKKLKAKKKYYVRIRTYKTIKVNGKNTKVYSSWVTKSVKTKK